MGNNNLTGGGNRINSGNRINNSRGRNRIDNRDFNLDNSRNFSNRVNRNLVNVNNRNIVANPRGWNSWGWNGGSPWSPNYGFWGGGFWGSFALGAATAGVTSAIVSSASNNNDPNFVVIDSSSPGNTLFTSYGLVQVACDSEDLVLIYGPQDSLVCARPTSDVPIGVYDVEPSDMTLIARY